MDLEERSHLIHLTESNRKSFLFIHKRYQSKVYYYSLKLIRNREVAEEITSDVFVKLWEKRFTVKTDRSVSGLLYKITRDFSISYLRKVSKSTMLRKAFLDQYTTDLSNPIEDQLDLEEGIQNANEAIDRLPPKCRQVFRLRYISDLSLHQIANKLHISPNTVQNHLSKGARIVKAHLRADADLVLIILTCQFI